MRDFLDMLKSRFGLLFYALCIVHLVWYVYEAYELYSRRATVSTEFSTDGGRQCEKDRSIMR